MENWKAVELVKDFLFGIGLYALITLSGVLFSLLFSNDSNALLLNDEVRGEMMARSLMWMTVPALLLAFLFAWLRRITIRNAALRLSIVWTVLLFVLYAIAALGSGIFTVLLSSVSFYLFLAAIFLGPILYAFIKKLPA